MPLADDTAVLDAPTSSATRSPRIVRGLLLGAVSISLLGLALTGGGTTATLTATSTANSTTFDLLYGDPVAPHVIVPTTAAAAPVAAAAPRPAARSSRSRSAAPKKKKVSFSGGWVRPSYASVVSPYGIRWGRMHKGIDFGASYGASIRAIGDGVVVGTGYQGEESGYGLITIIRHSNGYYSAYAHQSRDVVSVGDRVHAGEVIGYVGSTGHSTGPHLHFEIRTSEHGGQINPSTWLRKHGVYV